MVVLAITVLLTGLLLPAIIQVRHNVYRLVSASNLRQIGLGIVMYERDEGSVPFSYELEENQKPQELMVAHIDDPDEWDGLGRLHGGQYCFGPDVFYSPSHTGSHPLSRYEVQWLRPSGTRIYTNYHYCGHIDWWTGNIVRLEHGAEIMLATDGLREKGDQNHREGLNVLRGDGSVRWWTGYDRLVVDVVPEVASPNALPPADPFRQLWRMIEEGSEP